MVYKRKINQPVPQADILEPKDPQRDSDDEVFTSASKIRSSAAFGEIIILIVYLPILALVGVEGKMFKPMAQTVAFALVGAFILSLTYVPMMSALFLSKKVKHKENISDRIMKKLENINGSILNKILNIKKNKETRSCTICTNYSLNLNLKSAVNLNQKQK